MLIQIYISKHSHKMKALTLILCISLSVIIHGKSYSYATCLTNTYRNPANLECLICPTNQVSNNYQTLPIFCQCKNGFYPSTNANPCIQLAASSCGGTNDNFYAIYDLNGASSTSISTCTACAGNAYPDM